jgi:hypothetical protein
MQSVFRKIAKAHGAKFITIKKSTPLDPSELDNPCVVFNPHSAFENCRWMLDDPRCRIFHLIRDPRDVIISAAHHHLKSGEAWLHKPMPAFDGQTYQEKINSLPDDRSRYVFEMQNSANRVIKAMRKWNYNLPSSIEFKYEQMILDSDMILFTEVLNHLGFRESELARCRKIIKDNSLFGQVSTRSKRHINSGQPGQWKAAFDAKLARKFISLFGNVLVDLGYESDNSWAEALPSRTGQIRGRQDHLEPTEQ